MSTANSSGSDGQGCGEPKGTHVPVSHRFGRLGSLHPGWAAIAAVIVGLTTVGLVTGIARFATRGAWWNLPGVVVGTALGYWWAVPAWRLARHREVPDQNVDPGPQPGHTL